MTRKNTLSDFYSPLNGRSTYINKKQYNGNTISYPSPPHPYPLALHIIFSTKYFLREIVLRQEYCSKNIGSELRCTERYVTYFFPLNVVTAARHCRYRGITASYLPFTRYYHKIFPVLALITAIVKI